MIVLAKGVVGDGSRLVIVLVEGVLGGADQGLLKPGPALPGPLPPRGAREAQPGTVPAPGPHQALVRTPQNPLRRFNRCTRFW